MKVSLQHLFLHRSNLKFYKRRRLATALSFLSAICGLQGCNVGPKYRPPVMPAPPAFKEEGPQQAPDGTTWKAALPRESALRGKWWEIYQEPELNALEEKLNISNQNIAQAFDNFMAARAQVRQARSNYYPILSVGPSYARNRSSQIQTTTSGSSNRNPNSNLFSLPFDVSWEPDLWGRIRNTVHQSSYAAQVSAADLENQRLAEQANLAVYYFELRGQDALEELYRKTVEVDQQSLALTHVLYKTGMGNDEAVAQAEITLKTAEAAATNAGIARAQYEHAIALLVGEPASSFSIQVKSLSTPVPAIPVGVPSELLERRPDIAAAERTMAEANALIGVEKAAYYPTVSISGTAGYESPKFSKWMTSPSRYWSVGPTASETIFDGGLRKSTVAQYTALYNRDVANYRQIVLAAFQQTEDYLASLRLLKVQIEQQQEGVNSAQRYLEVATARYKTGLDPYLDLFTAQSTLLTNQQAVITLRVQQMASSVQLIEALGGGWSIAQLPSERQVSAKLP
ncbi:efflux transporter outer membrane subunit [Edaphobacter sp. HDX4]|uniref:efflux transporter outer membrane subunit n=1 Tax=Edaphobacter sp. HDX4 TaxID=2794064 RepID=UPI002FE64CD4